MSRRSASVLNASSLRGDETSVSSALSSLIEIDPLESESSCLKVACEIGGDAGEVRVRRSCDAAGKVFEAARSGP